VTHLRLALFLIGLFPAAGPSAAYAEAGVASDASSVGPNTLIYAWCRLRSCANTVQAIRCGDVRFRAAVRGEADIKCA
jgi:hypothetical protein